MAKSAGGQSRSSVTGKFVTGTYAKSGGGSSRPTERGMQAAHVQYRPAPRSANSQIKPPASSSQAKRQGQ
jgi:hypothetical protein